MRTAESDRKRRFDALFASYSADIVAYCGWRVASASDAQDAVAEVFLTAWRRIDTLPDGDAARVWLYATARRVIANQRRSSRRRHALHERLALEAASTPPGSPAPSQEEAFVDEALRHLRLRDREVLLLAEWEGLTPAQIAVVLGCSTGYRPGPAAPRPRPLSSRLRGVACPRCERTAEAQRLGGVHELSLRPNAAMRQYDAVARRRIMNRSESFRALRRANPRARVGFAESVEAAAAAVHAGIVAAPADGPHRGDAVSRPRRRLVQGSAAGATVVAAAAAALFLTIGSPGGGPGVENAAAAVEQAATVTAASAEHSGTVVVHMTHNGTPWAAKTVRWNGGDVAIVEGEAPGTGRRELRVVDGTLYGPDEDGGWLALGSPASIDPDSGTTPGEHLAAVREDIGGVTLRRITGAITGLTTAELEDGSTVYRGTVAAGLIARETGFKEGQSIRVLPFGYVAHDEAASPAAPLNVAVTVGADGVVRQIAVTWGANASAWTYTVTYSGLGATPAPFAPANARSLSDLRRRAVPALRPGSGN